MLKDKAFAVLAMAIGCSMGSPTQIEEETAPKTIKQPTTSPAEAMMAVADDSTEQIERRAINRYGDWETWAEDIIKPECISDEDCEPDRTGRNTQCVKPKGAENDIGTCQTKWLTRKQQNIQCDNQRMIVDAVCKPPSWWDDVRKWGLERKWGDDVGKLCGSYFSGRSSQLKTCIKKRYCDPERLHRMLRVPAKRESTWNHHTDHRLNQDLLANIGSYRRAYSNGVYADNPYFTEGLTLGDKGQVVFGRRRKKACPKIPCLPYRMCLPMGPNDSDPSSRQNPLDRNCDGVPDRWGRGYGWYGANAANFVYEWDPLAPPEILAQRVPATLAVLRKMRRAWRKYTNGIDCGDRNGVAWSRKNPRPRKDACENPARKYEAYGQANCRDTLRADWAKDTWETPTWWTLHRAVWNGDICPESSNNSYYERRFAARATKIDLDPGETVTLEMLGKPVAKKDQWELHSRLEQQFEEVFP